MDSERIFDGLNTEQRRAVETVRGPVCILAGAGSGKTTTITRRIANQVASDVFAAEEILAVTFTDKAATEMRERLAALGVRGVTARTFHSAALAQLREHGGEIGKIFPSKALALRQIGNTLPPPYKFRPAGDLATEVEWAKNRRLTPEAYLEGLGEHEPPIPPELMLRVFRRYEDQKAERALVDFEDLLEVTIRLFDEDPAALADVQARYRAFTVDEYQDVNLLQQTLLERWLGSGDELCAVGDDYQSIYAFTGATPEYLLGLPARYPRAAVIRLEANYRSSPEVLGLANRIVPALGGATKVLRAMLGSGPEPDALSFATREAEIAFVVERIRKLREAGAPFEEMAVLCRTNARLADFEEPFHDAKIPFQGAALLGREAARQLLRQLRKVDSTAVAAVVRSLAEEAGWRERLPEKLGERELVRQADLFRLIRLAQDFDDGIRTTADFIAELEARFGSTGAERRGVHLLTLHGANRGTRAADPAGEEACRDRRGAAPALRRPDARQAPARSDLERQAEPLPGGARNRDADLASSARTGARRPALQRPQALAARAGHRRRPARIRRLPQLDARGDRRTPAPRSVRARGSPWNRADEARPLRA